MQKSKLFAVLLLLAIYAMAKGNDKDVKEVCEPAQKGKDCSAYPFEICDGETKYCVHKGVFPLEVSEIICYLLIPLLLAIASIGGIGGGIILIPLLVGFFKFRTKEAIPITSSLVFLSATIRFCFFSAH